MINFAKLGGTRFLRRPKVDVDEVHVSGGLDVAAVVSTVTVSGQSREYTVEEVIFIRARNDWKGRKTLTLSLFRYFFHTICRRG